MASSIQEAMKRVMAERKANSGHRPPELTVTEDVHVNCGTCVHWDGRRRCLLFDYETQPDEVCASWSPEPQ